MPDDIRALIERSLASEGVTAEKWIEDGENGLEAILRGQWTTREENEDIGLYDGDEGIVRVCMVGSSKYGNQRANYEFVPEDCDSGPEVKLFDDVEPVS